MTLEQLEAEALELSKQLDRLLRGFYEANVEGKYTSEVFALALIAPVHAIALASGLSRDFIVELLDTLVKRLKEGGFITNA